jgi:hypothetical protein
MVMLKVIYIINNLMIVNQSFTWKLESFKKFKHGKLNSVKK